MWVAILLTAAAYETYGIISKAEGDTLSERLRLWFHTDSLAGSVAFVVALLGFVLWFIPHILLKAEMKPVKTPESPAGAPASVPLTRLSSRSVSLLARRTETSREEVDVLQSIKKEPVLISVLVGNLIALAAAFGLQLSETQTGAVMALVSTITVLIFGRPNVTPNVSVVARKDDGTAVAAEASVYQNGTPLETAPANLGTEQLQAIINHAADLTKEKIAQEIASDSTYTPKHG